MMNKRQAGFTLIELMIVVAIVGIIGAIAFPSYDSYMKKSRRSDAKVGMAKIADRLERYYINNDTYTTTVTDLGFADNQSENGYYTFAISTTNARANYTITATAQGAQTQDTDTSAGDCTVMTLDSTGLKGAPNTSTPEKCW